MTAPMRATIIPSDQFCSVDGVGFNGVDMTSVGPEVHAVQWYGTHGEVEVQDPSTGKMVTNEEITNLNDFQAVLDSYWIIRAAHDAEEQRANDESTVIEV
jgi:hypothetical protein